MNVLKLPVLVFGKAPAGQLPGAYEVLVRHPDFDTRAEQAVEQIRNGFQWTIRPGGTAHPSCFGLWPLEAEPRALLIRFSDQGRDDLGRPHCLRIDAALMTSGELLGSGKALAGLMRGGAWPREAPGAVDTDLVELRPEPPDSELARMIDLNRSPAGLPPPILAGDPDTFHNEAFGLLHRISRAAEAPVENRQSPVRQQSKPSSQTTPFLRKGWLWLAVAGVICFILGFAGGLRWSDSSAGHWRSEANRLELELREQKQQMERSVLAQSENLAAENAALTNRIRALEAALRKIRELIGHELESSPTPIADRPGHR